MFPIAIPMMELSGLHPGLTIGAVLGGAIFGHHCSPTSDSTVICSMAAATDHIDHARTQLPYALSAAGVSLLLYVILGASQQETKKGTRIHLELSINSPSTHAPSARETSSSRGGA